MKTSNSKRSDVQILAFQKKCANVQNNLVLHFTLYVGKKVLNHVKFKPQLTGDYLRLKNGKGLKAALFSSSEGVTGEIAVDGVWHYMMPVSFRYPVEQAKLYINHRCVKTIEANK